MHHQGSDSWEERTKFSSNQFIQKIHVGINSLGLSDTYTCMHHYNIPTLLQIMACCLFGNKLLSEPMLPYCQLDPKDHISVKFYLKVFIQENALENVVCKMWSFCLGLNVLSHWTVVPNCYNFLNIDICTQPLWENLSLILPSYIQNHSLILKNALKRHQQNKNTELSK